MENTLTTADIKRRGMAVIEDSLKKGPVHILKRNKAAAVILSEENYQQLISQRVKKHGNMTAAQWLLSSHTKGGADKREIDTRIADERGW